MNPCSNIRLPPPFNFAAIPHLLQRTSPANGMSLVQQNGLANLIQQQIAAVLGNTLLDQNQQRMVKDLIMSRQQQEEEMGVSPVEGHLELEEEAKLRDEKVSY